MASAENDDATNELIARILAADNEQQGYEATFDDYGDGEASDDSDFGRPRRKKPRGGAGVCLVVKSCHIPAELSLVSEQTRINSES